MHSYRPVRSKLTSHTMLKTYHKLLKLLKLYRWKCKRNLVFFLHKFTHFCSTNLLNPISAVFYSPRQNILNLLYDSLWLSGLGRNEKSRRVLQIRLPLIVTKHFFSKPIVSSIHLLTYQTGPTIAAISAAIPKKISSSVMISKAVCARAIILKYQNPTKKNCTKNENRHSICRECCISMQTKKRVGYICKGEQKENYPVVCLNR